MMNLFELRLLFLAPFQYDWVSTVLYISLALSGILNGKVCGEFIAGQGLSPVYRIF